MRASTRSSASGSSVCFRTPPTNRRGAQLIFNSHDPTLLGDSYGRDLHRDQVWFTEKGNDGASRLYSLAAFRPRSDEAISRRYLQGRYGAVPILDPGGFELATEPVAT